MKIEGIRLFSYALKLKKPLMMKNHLHKERVGLIVELMDDNQNFGYGEAAPFPGLHYESLATIIDQIQTLKPYLMNINLSNFDILNPDLPECSAILRFAIEWAIIDLLSKVKINSPAAVLNKNYERRVFINPILTGDIDSITEQAKVIKKFGPLSVKIKVGFRALEDDIFLVKEIDDIFENKVGLRLDANRSWSINQAVTFGLGVLSTNLEYIEEPLNDISLLEDFYKQTGILYALDETLTDNSISDADVINMKGIAAFIIKPSVIGSLKNITNWITQAEKKNIYCVFSNTFESGIGLWSNAHLAAAFSNKNVAHGLDTYSWFTNDLISPAFGSKNYKISIPDNPGYYTIKRENLNMLNI